MKDQFNNRPYLTKGTIVSTDLNAFSSLKNLLNPGSIIIFQYNPTNISRSFSARDKEEEGVIGYKQAPQEDMSLEIEISSHDQMTMPLNGIGPQLAALEMMLYPSSMQIAKDEIKKKIGVYEIVPPKNTNDTDRITWFIWGHHHIAPIHISKFVIQEEAYDHLLNPIRAKVSLDFRRLNYADFSNGSKKMYMANFVLHKIKEVKALAGSALNIANEAKKIAK